MMPINPTSITANSTISVVATAIFLNSLNINANQSTGLVSANASITPYAIVDEAAVFASSFQSMTTKDVNSACVVIPSFAVAMNAVQQAMVDWSNYVTTAQANLATAKTNLATCQIAVQNSRIAQTTAQSQVNLAQSNLNAANAELIAANAGGDAIAIASATTNVTTMQTALASSQSALTIAQTNAQTAQTNFSAAQTAVPICNQLIDPANANNISMKNK